MVRYVRFSVYHPKKNGQRFLDNFTMIQIPNSGDMIHNYFVAPIVNQPIHRRTLMFHSTIMYHVPRTPRGKSHRHQVGLLLLRYWKFSVPIRYGMIWYERLCSLQYAAQLKSLFLCADICACQCRLLRCRSSWKFCLVKDILLDVFWMIHHDRATRAKKDAVLLALTHELQEVDEVHWRSLTSFLGYFYNPGQIGWHPTCLRKPFFQDRLNRLPDGCWKNYPFDKETLTVIHQSLGGFI